MNRIKYLPLLLLLCSGCFKTVQNDIPPSQIAMNSPKRENEALSYFQGGQLAIQLGNFDLAFRLFGVVCKNYLETEAAPKAFHAWGHALHQLGCNDQAFEKLKFVTKNYMAYPAYEAVVREEFEIACVLMERYKNQSGKWRIFSFFKDAAPAIDCFHHIVNMAPHAPDAPKALFLAAILENDQGEKAKAIASLDQLLEYYPGSEWVPEAYLLEAEIYLSMVLSSKNDQGMTQKSIECYEDFLQIYGKNEAYSDFVKRAQEGLARAKNLYAESRFVMGDFFLYRRHYPEGAAVFYNETRSLAPQSDAAKHANQRIDFINAGGKAPLTWADHFWGRVVYRPAEH